VLRSGQVLRVAVTSEHHRSSEPPAAGGNVPALRYRCNLGLWIVAAMTVLPYAVITLLGSADIASSQAFAG